MLLPVLSFTPGPSAYIPFFLLTLFTPTRLLLFFLSPCLSVILSQCLGSLSAFLSTCPYLTACLNFHISDLTSTMLALLGLSFLLLLVYP